MSIQWKGVMPAVTTKFTDTDELDLKMFEKNIIQGNTIQGTGNTCTILHNSCLSQQVLEEDHPS